MIHAVESDETLRQLRRVILEQPDEDTPRLAFADRLEEIPAAEASCRNCKGRGSFTIYEGPGATNLAHRTCGYCHGDGVVMDDSHHKYADFIRLQIELSQFSKEEPLYVYGDTDRLSDGRVFLNCWQPITKLHERDILVGKLVKLMTKRPPHSGIILAFLVHAASSSVPEGDELAFKKARLGIPSMGNLFLIGEIVQDPWWVRKAEVDQKQHLMASCRISDGWFDGMPPQWKHSSDVSLHWKPDTKVFDCERGFISFVGMTHATFMKDAEAIFAYQPVRVVHLNDRKPVHWGDLHYWEAWDRLSAAHSLAPRVISARLAEKMTGAGPPSSDFREIRTYSFTSSAAALRALSTACVAYGREVAKLPCLYQTTRP